MALEGSSILSYRNGLERYIPIETITCGTSVLTPEGYKKVKLIRKSTIINRGDSERVKDRLYKCPVGNYMQLDDDLFLTGTQSILLPNLTDTQRRKMDENGQVLITGNKFRLMAFLDERAKPWVSEGKYTIWHLALESKDVGKTYGIYMNGGLLVETSSLQQMKGT
jgi:hypothetical protein